MVEMRGKIGKMVMFGVSGNDAFQVMQEVARYAELYCEEGTVQVQQKIDGRWKNCGRISQYPDGVAYQN